MTYWQTQHFKALQALWYERLEAQGFEDAEELVDGELVLKQNAQHPLKGADPIEIEQKSTYYRVIGARAHDHPFRKETDRIIMLMFAEGAKIKTIVEALTQAGARRCRESIRYTIRKYEMQWGLRQYTPRELNRVKAPKKQSA